MARLGYLGSLRRSAVAVVSRFDSPTRFGTSGARIRDTTALTRSRRTRTGRASVRRIAPPPRRRASPFPSARRSERAFRLGTTFRSASASLASPSAGVIPQAVLDAVESLSVSTWEPDGDDGRHVGPMAEEFAEVFELAVKTGPSPPSTPTGSHSLPSRASRSDSTRKTTASRNGTTASNDWRPKTRRCANDSTPSRNASGCRLRPRHRLPSVHAAVRNTKTGNPFDMIH